MNIIKLALTIILLNLFYFINKFECQKTDKLLRICYERVEGEKNELLCNDPDFKYINVLKASADFVKIGSPMPVCEVKADLEKDIKSTMNFCNGRSTCVITDKFLDDNKLFSFQNYVYTLDTEKYYPLVLKLTINYNCINETLLDNKKSLLTTTIALASSKSNFKKNGELSAILNTITASENNDFFIKKLKEFEIMRKMDSKFEEEYYKSSSTPLMVFTSSNSIITTTTPFIITTTITTTNEAAISSTNIVVSNSKLIANSPADADNNVEETTSQISSTTISINNKVDNFIANHAFTTSNNAINMSASAQLKNNNDQYEIPLSVQFAVAPNFKRDGSENTTRKHAPISEGVMIFLIVLGVLLFLIIVAILLIICVRRSRKAIYENEFNGGEENGTYSKQKTSTLNEKPSSFSDFPKNSQAKSSTEAIERNSDKFLLTDSPNNKKNQTTFETSGTYTSKQNTLYLNKAYIEENDLYSLPKKDEVEIKIDYDEYWRTKI